MSGRIEPARPIEAINLAAVADFTLGVLRVQPSLRRVSVGGREELVEPRVMQALIALAEAGGTVVSRDALIDRCWGGRIVGEDAINRCIGKVRKLADIAEPAAFTIETVAKVGYRLRVPQAAVMPLTSLLQREPDARRRQATDTQHDRRGASRLLQWREAGIAAFLISVAVYASVLIRRPVSPADQPTPEAFNPPPHSVAVLAFANLSGEPGQDYLSDGLSEELIDSLSQIREVQVTARTSSFFYKSKPAKIKDIAQALNVAAVVEGSMRRQGNHLRIEARLINARTGFKLWSHSYESDLGDMLKLEGDIAAQVAEALQVNLVAGQAPEDSSGGTSNAQALDAYLRGVQAIRHDSVRSYRAALAHFDAAIAADRNFALAYAGKANALNMIINNEDASDATPGMNVASGRFSDALNAAKLGVKLAPGIGATHIALANILDNGLDLVRAWAEAERAEALAPGDATVDLLFSFIALCVNHRQAAISAARRAIELDPLREDGWLNLGQQYRIARDYDGAFKAYQHAQTLAGSETPLIAYERALAYISMGNPQRALSISLGGTDWTHMECRAIAQHALGRRHDAEQTFAELLKIDGANFNYVYAEIFAQWGQPVEAVQWLSKAKNVNDSGLSIIRFDPMMDPIRQTPGFKAIESSLNFPR